MRASAPEQVTSCSIFCIFRWQSTHRVLLNSFNTFSSLLKVRLIHVDSLASLICVFLSSVRNPSRRHSHGCRFVASNIVRNDYCFFFVDRSFNISAFEFVDLNIGYYIFNSFVAISQAQLASLKCKDLHGTKREFILCAQADFL